MSLKECTSFVRPYAPLSQMDEARGVREKGARCLLRSLACSFIRSSLLAAAAAAEVEEEEEVESFPGTKQQQQQLIGMLNTAFPLFRPLLYAHVCMHVGSTVHTCTHKASLSDGRALKIVKNFPLYPHSSM